MRKAFYISVIGHLATVALLLFFSWAFSRPEKRSYPKMITATLVAKSPSVSKPQPKRAQPPQPERTIEPKVNKQAVKKTSERRRPQPAAVSKKTDQETPALSSPGMKIDAPEFPFPEYLALIQYRIESQWRPPANAGGGLLTTISFRIGTKGGLSEVKISKSSGNFVVDQSALRAVYAADPLPPLPAGAGLPSLGVHFDFVVY